MAGNSGESGRSVTSKITSILMAFTEGSVHSLTEIARLAGLPVSTAHRLTSELASWRLLERTEDGNYRIGLPLRMIGAGDAEPPSVAERAPWVLEDVAAATRSPARLGVLVGLDVAYIEKRPGGCPVTSFHPAATLPAHPTALGRALLAFAGQDVVEATLARGLRPYTPQTITAPDRFRRALGVARLTRTAVTRGELEAGVCGVAMPVFGAGGDVVAAIELTVGDLGRELPTATAALAVASRSLSRELATETHCDHGTGDHGTGDHRPGDRRPGDPPGPAPRPALARHVVPIDGRGRATGRPARLSGSPVRAARP